MTAGNRNEYHPKLVGEQYTFVKKKFTNETSIERLVNVSVGEGTDGETGEVKLHGGK